MPNKARKCFVFNRHVTVGVQSFCPSSRKIFVRRKVMM
jgi:hypothetical protein